ncbi:MAG: hypothetical protein DSY82_05510 [Flavobacteriia bacterium]|nr:MAG: hypothetical protein DSY82_05510 [Flavobacteriia bacterium]
MNGLSSNNAPHPSVVKPHFIFGSLALLVLSVMIFLADTTLLGSYFDSKMIAITHMAVLGWATMIVFGALYQLIPVVFETSLFSEKLAKFTFWMAGLGVLLLTYAFWIGDFTGLLPYAALLMFVSLLLFVVNVILSYKDSKKKNISSRFVITAVGWLSVTELIGTLIAFNFKYNYFTEAHLHYLKIHASIGLIGWFLMLIIGVGSVLMPMFMVSHQLDDKKLERSYYFINFGLLVMAVNWLFIHFEKITPLFWLSIVTGIYFFISYVYDSYKKRIRKVLDIGMKHTMISVLSIFLPVIISLIILFGIGMDSMLLLRTTTLYGFTIIFGLITTIILGQTYKTLPFIIWLEKYQALVGKTKTPMPRELYSEKIADLQLLTYLFFIIFMIMGVLLNQIWLVRIGSYLLLAVAVLYNINVFKIIFHQVKKKV